MNQRHWIGTVFGAFWLLSCASDQDPVLSGTIGGASSGAKGGNESTTASIGGASSEGGAVGSPGGGVAGARASTKQGLLGEAAKAELERVKTALTATRGLDATSILANHKVDHPALGYDPLEAQYLSLINASPLALSIGETQILGRNGFVISDSQRFCSFYHGLDSIYAADLPVFVSADAILEAVHRSYDAALKELETTYLIQEVTDILSGMRARLSSVDASDELRADADLYLAVAAGLLSGATTGSVTGASGAKVSELLSSAKAASGLGEVTLFGQRQSLDWSQFAPRGHYTETPELQQYFRAMIWLGRTPMRLVATDEMGNQRLMRRQVDAAFLMSELLNEDGLVRWRNVEEVLAAFVGENDNMTPAEIPALLAALGVTDRAGTAAVDDATLMNALLLGGYGSQRIVSQIMYNGIDKTLPAERVFLLFGQRYVVDAHVFSNVVYDRVGGGSVKRMMPSTLDVAYAALGNDDALPLLSGQLTQFGYAPELESMRILVDEHGDDYWQSSLYTRWLGALRALSPATALAPTNTAALPAIAKSAPWGRRILNTQLGSWAELRHDTLLYAKQSYTSYPACEYPDAYVDPYPEFFSRLTKLAERGVEVAALVEKVTGTSSTALTAYFTKLASTATMLHDMATEELTGAPFTQDQIDFVNRAVRFKEVDVVCATVMQPSGWYVDLFLNQADITKCQPTIADVHTQPADAAGTEVGRILHVGTGYPRLMVTTMDTCTGPKAYVGVVFAYHERIAEKWKRLTDEEWGTEVASKSPADVEWMSDLVAP